MPNHVINEVRLHCVGLDRLTPMISGKNGAIDFETLVPLPINFWPGNVGREHREAFPGTQLDAAVTTWGTKWNAYALSDESVRVDGDDVVLTFETAWSPPRGWIVALFNSLGCRITHHWNDEGSEAVVVETYEIHEPWGAEWTRQAVDPGTPDHRRIYRLQWGVETPAELHSE